MKEIQRHHENKNHSEPFMSSFHSPWNIPWQEFEVILGIKNSFSQRNLNFKTEAQAEIFLKNCGFDLTNQMHIKQFEQFFGEALFFIRHILFTHTERDKFIVPSQLLHMTNPCDLLIHASSFHPRKRYLRLWCCSILKVMYAISNLQYSGRLHIIDDAREQIFSRIRNILHQNNNETLDCRFKDLIIRLNKVEWKEAKTRTSIVLKLLHKPDSIVDEVFDYLGVRFVVQNPNEIPLLLKLLIEADIIIPHQVVSIRTRNSLLNIKHPKKVYNFLKELNSCGTLTDKEFEEMCKNMSWSGANLDEIPKRANSFTSQHYKSLQFTVRHLVRTPNPAFLVLESMTNQLRRYTGILRQEPWMESVIPQYFAHYFPIEIQMMDQESYEMAKFGPASHEQYKANQLKAVRERVLGNLMTFHEEKLTTQEL
ncbi:TIGR04552 family protein [Silvanigrella paludirubra]|uniref:TIGR04552 family protein n=1 Tax=Silvanigrella paludirubra TaxID=2499159 RepID=A0A6N6VRQ2_9BACT|nr:TIGR04552 family protein [Silvanigrella paludirubra]KAB8037688.1 TIGR04552 family protein [Silvanigrella paludirubra]